MANNIKLYCGDCRDVLKTLESNSVDSVVTDPPAGISFMGKEWDHNKGGRDEWIKWMESIAGECLRVLKPGGHALVWGLPRTSHWTTTAWENAGFEVRDSVYHIFGSGFPKSLDIGKAIDKQLGAERKVTGKKIYADGNSHAPSVVGYTEKRQLSQSGAERVDTIPASEQAKQWEGWGTALKPAVEIWLLLRKPISEKTIAANVVKWGTGGINIDECRIESNEITGARESTVERIAHRKLKFGMKEMEGGNPTQGRFPANLIHDGSSEVLKIFPITKSWMVAEDKDAYECNSVTGFLRGKTNHTNQYGDEGSAARFFYCAKPDGAEKNEGVEGIGAGNSHPTVKPLKLMQYLVALITPPNGICLDPFMGSGTTGVACRNLNIKFIGIEKEEKSFLTAKNRIHSDLFTIEAANE